MCAAAPVSVLVVQSRSSGKERDSETGLDYFGARYYGSSMGRFLTPDWSATPVPTPFADLTDPQTLNLYGYVRNNPVTRADADGHCEIVCITIVVAITAGTAAYGLYHFWKEGEERQRQADAKTSNFLNNPSTAPIEDLSASNNAKVELYKDAAVEAIKSTNPSQGAESVGGAVVETVVGEAEGRMVDAAANHVRNQQSNQAAPNQGQAPTTSNKSPAETKPVQTPKPQSEQQKSSTPPSKKPEQQERCTSASIC